MPVFWEQKAELVFVWFAALAQLPNPGCNMDATSWLPFGRDPGYCTGSSCNQGLQCDEVAVKYSLIFAILLSSLSHTGEFAATAGSCSRWH